MEISTTVPVNSLKHVFGLQDARYADDFDNDDDDVL